MRGTFPKLIYIVILAAAAVVYLSGSNIKNILNLKKEVSFYEAKLKSIKEDNSRLEKEISWMQNNDDYVKYLAKKKLGLVEPGEIKYYLVEKE